MEDEEEVEEELFEVEAITDTRKKDGVRYYKVRWKGYGPEDDTWEPERNVFECEDVLEEFRKKKREKERLKQKKRRRVQAEREVELDLNSQESRAVSSDNGEPTLSEVTLDLLQGLSGQPLGMTRQASKELAIASLRKDDKAMAKLLRKSQGSSEEDVAMATDTEESVAMETEEEGSVSVDTEEESNVTRTGLKNKGTSLSVPVAASKTSSISTGKVEVISLLSDTDEEEFARKLGQKLNQGNNNNLTKPNTLFTNVKEKQITVNKSTTCTLSKSKKLPTSDNGIKKEQKAVKALSRVPDKSVKSEQPRPGSTLKQHQNSLMEDGNRDFKRQKENETATALTHKSEHKASSKTVTQTAGNTFMQNLKEKMSEVENCEDVNMDVEDTVSSLAVSLKLSNTEASQEVSPKIQELREIMSNLPDTRISIDELWDETVAEETEGESYNFVTEGTLGRKDRSKELTKQMTTVEKRRTEKTALTISTSVVESKEEKCKKDFSSDFSSTFPVHVSVAAKAESENNENATDLIPSAKDSHERREESLKETTAQDKSLLTETVVDPVIDEVVKNNSRKGEHNEISTNNQNTSDLESRKHVLSGKKSFNILKNFRAIAAKGLDRFSALKTSESPSPSKETMGFAFSSAKTAEETLVDTAKEKQETSDNDSLVEDLERGHQKESGKEDRMGVDGLNILENHLAKPRKDQGKKINTGSGSKDQSTNAADQAARERLQTTDMHNNNAMRETPHELGEKGNLDHLSVPCKGKGKQNAKAATEQCGLLQDKNKTIGNKNVTGDKSKNKVLGVAKGNRQDVEQSTAVKNSNDSKRNENKAGKKKLVGSVAKTLKNGNANGQSLKSLEKTVIEINSSPERPHPETMESVKPAVENAKRGMKPKASQKATKRVRQGSEGGYSSEKRSKTAPEKCNDIVGSIIQESVDNKSSSLVNKSNQNGVNKKKTKVKKESKNNSNSGADVMDFSFDLDDYPLDQLVHDVKTAALRDIPSPEVEPMDIPIGALKQAIRNGDEMSVRGSLAAGHDIEAVDGASGMTMLQFAAAAGAINIVELLLRRGGKVDAAQKNGMTALMHAAEQGFPETVDILLRCGADINWQQNSGETALMKACRKGHTEVIGVLLRHGADTKIRLSSGLTAQQYAMRTLHYYEIPSLLAEHESRLTRIVESAIATCAGSTVSVCVPPVMPYRCLSPREGAEETLKFDFQAERVNQDSDIILFCIRANFCDDKVSLTFGDDNGIRSVILNDKTLLPLLHVCINGDRGGMETVDSLTPDRSP